VSTGGFSAKRLARVRDLLERHVGSGCGPGVVAVVARHGEVHVEAAGTLAFEGAGAGTAMAADTICRIASMTKPVVAACAMTLVEDCTLRLDDPVDGFLPELADMTVLIARATGMSFGNALRERVFEPLGMKDTAFSVSGENLSRLATAYEPDAATGKPVVKDGPDGRFSRPPKFEDGGGGLVSTADDYLAFASALLAGGTHHGERVLSRPSVTLMTSDQLTPAQKAVSGFGPGYFDDIGWGFGMSVRTRRTHLGPSVGSYGWPGYYGTAWYNDPAEDMTTILMIQQAEAPVRLPIFLDLCTAAYQAIDD
jgi:CubicO group peptidase (beta-lactamase class C family)